MTKPGNQLVKKPHREKQKTSVKHQQPNLNMFKEPQQEGEDQIKRNCPLEKRRKKDQTAFKKLPLLKNKVYRRRERPSIALVQKKGNGKKASNRDPCKA